MLQQVASLLVLFVLASARHDRFDGLGDLVSTWLPLTTLSTIPEHTVIISRGQSNVKWIPSSLNARLKYTSWYLRLRPLKMASGMLFHASSLMPGSGVESFTEPKPRPNAHSPILSLSQRGSCAESVNHGHDLTSQAQPCEDPALRQQWKGYSVSKQ